MKKDILQNIKSIAKKDFISVEMDLSKKIDTINASINDIEFSVKGNAVTATCDFRESNSPEVVEASIVYTSNSNNIYADVDTKKLSRDIKSAISSSLTSITAADEDERFSFDDEFDDEPFGGDEMLDEESDEFVPEELSLEDEDYENPESDPDIETDNNISGHYIVECDRCHGIFISALVESDQQVEFISGVCPLCEKESDQYIKWVVKPVEIQ